MLFRSSCAQIPCRTFIKIPNVSIPNAWMLHIPNVSNRMDISVHKLDESSVPSMIAICCSKTVWDWDYCLRPGGRDCMGLGTTVPGRMPGVTETAVLSQRLGLYGTGDCSPQPKVGTGTEAPSTRSGPQSAVRDCMWLGLRTCADMSSSIS